MPSPISEQIETLQSRRATTLTLLESMHEKAVSEGRAFSTEEQLAFDAASNECNTINAQLETLDKLQSVSAKSARPLGMAPGYPTSQNPVGRRTHERGMGNLPPGTAFARFAMCLAAGRGNLLQSAELAKSLWPDFPQLAGIIKHAAGVGGTAGDEWAARVIHTKAAVAAGTTTDPTWAAPLVDYATMQDEFIGLLHPATIIGRLQGFRRVPFNIRIPRQTSGTSVGWVGEAKPKPVSKMGFDAVTLPWAKVAGICAITEELARFSSPSAEALVRDDLVATISDFLNVAFIDPTQAPNPAANSPASITYGAEAIPSTGNTVSAITADIQAALSYVSQNGLPLDGLAWVMNPRTKIYLSMLRLGTADGVFAFPEVAASSTLAGFPIVDSASVPIAADSSTFIALVKPSEILIADDGGVTLDASREASIAMSDDGTGSLVSLWQNNLVGIRAERYVFWQPRRAACCVVISGITY
ncbi:phage major capsid protein [Cupriavidus sp. D384]|uniref:phage major capsid protein n=1 Tax=Cupriavidus sp. D384 TaxID=1538095 RepID=UPI00082F00F8|nr:phage major capsid protein [Cupriavidus sp. D384]